jgi:hypothetical protein
VPFSVGAVGGLLYSFIADIGGMGRKAATQNGGAVQSPSLSTALMGG